MASFTIQLLHLRFFGAHGVFDEEKSTGNEFEVSLWLTLKAPKEKLTSLEQSINYAEVYRLTKDIMLKPQPLLESLAMDIAEAIKDYFPALKRIRIQLIKQHPPILSFSGAVGVTFKKSYKKTN